MEGWHFLRESRTLGYDDNRHVAVGEMLTVDGDPELCMWGLHASKRAIDALVYAPGPLVCRVDVGGKIVEGDDKFVGTSRKVLWMADATKVLHEFACWCAERALLREREAGREPDPRSWRAIEVKRAWISGEATDDELRAAQDAAWAAARAAAQDAAWAAAQDAAWAAAWAAAQDAAWAAAWAAAQDAARAAAWAAARAAAWAAEHEAQNAKLEEMLWSLKEGA